MNSKTQDDLTEYMTTQARLCTQDPGTIDRYLNWQHSLMKQVPISISASTPEISEVVRRVKSEVQYPLALNQCYRNALNISLGSPEIQYVEGYVKVRSTGKPVAHAWNVIRRGSREFHFDVTLEFVVELERLMPDKNEYFEVMREDATEALAFVYKSKNEGPLLFDKFRSLENA